MSEKTWCVYKHTNKANGKVYIGITSQETRIRWNHGWGYQGCPHFWRAIQKYGWDGFEHEVLMEGLSHDEANRMEVALIAAYRSAEYDYGYNVSLGGNTCGKHSEETKRKLGEVRRGKHHTEESRRKMSEAHKGKVFSAELIQKFKMAQFGGKHHRARPVCQMSLSGEFIERYDCIADAERRTGICNQNIGKCCRGRRANAGGFQWKYAEEVSE